MYITEIKLLKHSSNALSHVLVPLLLNSDHCIMHVMILNQTKTNGSGAGNVNLQPVIIYINLLSSVAFCKAVAKLQSGNFCKKKTKNLEL